MLDILETLNNWLKENRKIALATVVETWGSAPRQAGAKMGITADMGMCGSVSGGCVETAVVQEALDTLEDGKPRLLYFGVSDDTAWDIGLACGGKISVFVEPLEVAWWEAIEQHVQQDKAYVTIMILKGDHIGKKMLLDETGVVYSTIPDDFCDAFINAGQNALKQNKSSRESLLDQDILIDIYQPRPRLVIVGGAHVAIALNTIAHLLGFRVMLIDPRRAFATKERFPDVEMISHSYPDKAFAEMGITAETYIAILTHDPKIDDPALRAALPANAPYVGVLSSKRTHEQRIKRLTEGGLSTELLARIRTPIGIEIGAKTPEEIALCIMAEIVAIRNGVL